MDKNYTTIEFLEAVRNIAVHAFLHYDDSTFFARAAEKTKVMHNKLKDWASGVAKTIFTPADNVWSDDDSSQDETVNSPQQPGNLERVDVDDHDKVEIVPTSDNSFPTID